MVLPPSCRYQPSCSAYAIEAIQRYGALKGGWLAVKRILRCHPWGGAGHRPSTLRFRSLIRGELAQRGAGVRVVAAGAVRLAVRGETISSRRPTRRATKVVDGKSVPLPAPGATPPADARAADPRARCRAEGRPARRDRYAAPPGLDQPQGRPHRRSRDGQLSRDDRQGLRRRSACSRRAARPRAYFAGFGLSGDGLVAPNDRDGMDGRRHQRWRRGKPVTLSRK